MSGICSRRIASRALLTAILCTLCLETVMCQQPSGDSLQWGGSPTHNNVRHATAIPGYWWSGVDDVGAWDRSRAKNVKWCVNIGSQTYGNPIVAGGKVFVGTNNGAGWLKRYPPSIDLGCLLCFSEKDGTFLW